MPFIRVLFIVFAVVIGCFDWVRFFLGKRMIRRTQLRILNRIVQQNRLTAWGRGHDFDRIKSYEDFRQIRITNYDDYEDYIRQIRNGDTSFLTLSSVETLLPTSGSTRGTKLIPFTTQLKSEFRRALNVWLVNLFLRSPKALCGWHYWSMSPAIKYLDEGFSSLPIGFADDMSYFGPLQSKLLTKSFVVPPPLMKIDNPVAHEYLTLLFLLRERNLSFVFIWSPTFLIAKLDKINVFREKLLYDIAHGTVSVDIINDSSKVALFKQLFVPDPKRAEELALIDFSDRSLWHHIWPGLKMMSCWADGSSVEFKNQLAKLFPRAILEEKGLVATEAVVTIPSYQGTLKPVAYCSHFFEFRDLSSGCIKPLWEIVCGTLYSVVVTTGGGLYRYAMNDIVEVTGFLGDIPCLRFIGRENAIVDLVGEKISEQTVVNFLCPKENLSISSFSERDFAFSLVAPTRIGTSIAYTLFVEPKKSQTYDYARILFDFDKELNANIHYRHARALGQLQYPRLYVITFGKGLSSYCAHEVARGKREGDIKRRFLDGAFGWEEVFLGEFIRENLPS